MNSPAGIARNPWLMLIDAYSEQFGGSSPDQVNQSHQLIILASALDESSEWIIWLRNTTSRSTPFSSPSSNPTARSFSAGPGCEIRRRFRKRPNPKKLKESGQVVANQNIVCKPRHPETVEFLKREFDV